MAKKLTDVGIRNLKPAQARREVADGGCTGLYLLVQPNNKRSWAVRYRYHGRPCKLTLGSLPPLTLAEARKLATEALHGLARDIDPATVKRHAKQAETERARDTIERLAALYLDQHARKKTREVSWKAVEGTFTREVLPRWGTRLASDISRKDVKELIRAIAKDRPIMANRAQSHLGRFFKWLVHEDYVVGSPAVGIERPAKENARERSLSDDEVRVFWKATDTLSGPFGDIYKLLLLSGARRQEVAEMEWRELDLERRVWTLPSQRSKNGLPNMLPLSPLAWDIIERQPHISDYVFGRARSGFHQVKQKLDAAMQTAEPWVTHDLRRTARSLLGRARVASDIAELCLGHLLVGMRKVYDKHDYIDEKRAAFVALEREIDLIINPQAAEVIPLRR
jgi:integrase